MKRKTMKKALAIALSGMLAVSGVNLAPAGMGQVQAAAAVKDVNLGLNGFLNPTSTGSDATEWAGSKVYYGGGGTPILWRVLDQSGFLFADGLVGDAYAYNGATWAESAMRTYLNGTGNAAGHGTVLGDYFTSAEREAIQITDVQTPGTPSIGSGGTNDGGADTKDQLFLLSFGEVQNSSYGFGSDGARDVSNPTGSTQPWYLRTPDQGVGSSVPMDVWGGKIQNLGFSASLAVRPAFHLDQSKVLLISAAGYSKGDFTAVGSTGASANTWKLTVEGTATSLNAATTDSTTWQEGYSAQKLAITHDAATALTDATQVSAVLTDSNGTVMDYGRVNVSTSATGSDVTVPAGLGAGTYSLYVFAEDVNYGSQTDYATALGSPITITVKGAVSQNTENTTSGSSSGSGGTKPAPLTWSYPKNQPGSDVQIDHQGTQCMASFRAGTPAGYQEGFSFNLYLNGKLTYDPKQKTLKLTIPAQFRTSGRTFAVIGVDKNGQPHLFRDLDSAADTVTVNIDGFAGYAFDLIYLDTAK